jgi:hypothetical protein
MRDFNGQDYGVCKYCGAPKVLNPKTNKIFCSAKCWLKKPPVERTQAQNLPLQAPQVSRVDLDGLEDKVDALTRKINEVQFAVHALWAVLIQGDKEKEKQYGLHKIPLVAKSKLEEPEPEVPTWEEPPF